MNKIAVFPGSFDPLTKGHCDIMLRAANLWDELRVVVVHNPKKDPFFSLKQRVVFIEQFLENVETQANIVVDVLQTGLLSHYCQKNHASVIVKGLRSEKDTSYEIPQAFVNRNLGDIETVFLLTDPAYAWVSSSLVREVVRLQGNVSEYVPSHVAQFVSLLT